jgi:tellurite resistance protein
MRAYRGAPVIPASFFAMVLGTCGLGQAWHGAEKLWSAPAYVAQAITTLSALLWLGLMIVYLSQIVLQPDRWRAECADPIRGGSVALPAVATLLIAIAIKPWHCPASLCLTAVGIAWQLAFTLWHTGQLWKGQRSACDSLPTLYVPSVAGSFACAMALGAWGYADWGWLFFGAGLFAWLALEPLILQRLWLVDTIPPAQRPLLGIQFAPPAVASMAYLTLMPEAPGPCAMMLWGYALFQLLLGMRLRRWLTERGFDLSWWAYSFGVVAAAGSGVKLAAAGVGSAQILAGPVFCIANIFIGYLSVCTAGRILKRVRYGTSESVALSGVEDGK